MFQAFMVAFLLSKGWLNLEQQQDVGEFVSFLMRMFPSENFQNRVRSLMSYGTR